MKHVTVSVAILLLSLPAAASAQDDRAPTVKAAGQAPQAPRPQQQLVPTRRRGSMVGYIESALVDTRVRVRFDGGTGIDTPDRAEFFTPSAAAIAISTAIPPSIPTRRDRDQGS